MWCGVVFDDECHAVLEDFEGVCGLSVRGECVRRWGEGYVVGK